MVGTALDVNDFQLAAAGLVRGRIDEHSAAHCAIRAGRARFLGLDEPEGLHVGRDLRLRLCEAKRADRGSCGAGTGQLHEPSA